MDNYNDVDMQIEELRKKVEYNKLINAKIKCDIEKRLEIIKELDEILNNE